MATQMALNYPDIPGLQYLGTGGEKLMSLNPPSYNLLNAYGPTETTVLVESVSEGPAGFTAVGRSYAEAADVDGVVRLTPESGSRPKRLILPGDYVRARITRAHQYDLDAVIENQQE